MLLYLVCVLLTLCAVCCVCLFDGRARTTNGKQNSASIVYMYNTYNATVLHLMYNKIVNFLPFFFLPLFFNSVFFFCFSQSVRLDRAFSCDRRLFITYVIDSGVETKCL